MASIYDGIDPKWRENSVLLLGNCPCYKNMTARRVIKMLGIPTIHYKPTSFIAIPLEKVVSAMKMRNTEIIRTPLIDLQRQLNIKK
jgi:hypothetical protein